MPQIAFDSPDCKGITVERADGLAVEIRRPEKGQIVDVPDYMVRTMQRNPGASIYKKNFSVGANFVNGKRVWE